MSNEPPNSDTMTIDDTADAELKSENTSEKPEPVIIERRNASDRAQYKRSIYALPVTVQVVIGSARPTISELLQMKDGTLLTLDKTINDPVDLCINDRIIARGELIETDPATGALGIELTEIVDITEDVLS